MSNAKRPEAPTNSAIHLLWLPASTPYGNLALKHLKLVGRVDWLNLRIRAAYESYERAKNAPFPEGDLLEHLHVAEEIVYWIRRLTDELISLAYVLAERTATGEYPERVAIDSIGALLASGHTIRHQLNRFSPFLSRLNEISNAYKHSFLQSDLNTVGQDEPMVFSLALKRNDLKYQPEFQRVRLREVVEHFSDFYVYATGLVAGLSANLPHQSDG